MASNFAIDILHTNFAHACSVDSPDTWQDKVELAWTIQPTGASLPPNSHFEVVVWINDGNPLFEAQAYTLHEPDRITLNRQGQYTILLEPKALVEIFKRLPGQPTVSASQIYKWGVVLVVNGGRQKLLSPGDGCKFTLHSDVIK